MILSEQKPMEEVLESLRGEKRIFLLGCKGCAESSGTGGPVQVLEMKESLGRAGKTVTGHTVVDFLCQKALVKSRLRRFGSVLNDTDSILVMTCGIGVQAVAAVVDKVAHPACNTISLGGSRGEWTGAERCRECGDCLLDYTGGICPLTACTKRMLNGPCGGSEDGKCEVSKEIGCGWELIHERLAKLNRADKLKEMMMPKTWNKASPPDGIRSTAKWALETKEA
jgi:hypothetical protein